MPPAPLSLTATLADLRAGATTSLALVDEALARAAADDLGAFELLDADGARERARAADDERAAGGDRPLLGVPLAVKDVFDVAGWPTRGTSRAWRRRPREDATAVARVRAAGAVLLGKTHCNEFAFGIDGRNPHRPPCRNPHDRDRVPGGSSSGSGVAVAAGVVPGALGTDTSGSVRVPAALCGVVGLRTTMGRVPRAGVLPLAPAYDAVGPLARTCEDAALLLAALVRAEDGQGAAAAGAEPVRELRSAGLVQALLDERVCHPAVAAVVRAAAQRVADAGIEVRPVTVEGSGDALDVHRAVQVPEGARSMEVLGVDRAGLAPDVRARVEEGHARADGLPEAHRRRHVLREGLLAALAAHDVLLAPSAPCVAPPLDAAEVDLGATVRPVRDALLSCVVPFSQHGGPALSLPCGTVDGLPVGLQVVGRPGDDEALLALGTRIERALAGA